MVGFGRPTLFSEEIGQQYCEAIRQGMTRGRAAVAVGVNRNTIIRWKQMQPEFAIAAEVAEKQRGYRKRGRTPSAGASSELPDLRGAALRATLLEATGGEPRTVGEIVKSLGYSTTGGVYSRANNAFSTLLAQGLVEWEHETNRFFRVWPCLRDRLIIAVTQKPSSTVWELTQSVGAWNPNRVESVLEFLRKERVVVLDEPRSYVSAGAEVDAQVSESNPPEPAPSFRLIARCSCGAETALRRSGEEWVADWVGWKRGPSGWICGEAGHRAVGTRREEVAA